MSPIFGGRAGGIGLILCMVSLSGAEVPKQESIEVDARELTIEGRAWPGEGPTYGRLPRRIQGEIAYCSRDVTGELEIDLEESLGFEYVNPVERYNELVGSHRIIVDQYLEKHGRA